VKAAVIGVQEKDVSDLTTTNIVGLTMMFLLILSAMLSVVGQMHVGLHILVVITMMMMVVSLMILKVNVLSLVTIGQITIEKNCGIYG